MSTTRESCELETIAAAESPLDKLAETHVAIGQHLLVTLNDCDIDILNDIDALRDLTMRAAVATGATVLNLCAQKFEPQGVTVVAVLAESHASLHTYPEVRKVFWDCFTCGSTCDPSKSIEVLSAALKTKNISARILERE